MRIKIFTTTLILFFAIINSCKFSENSNVYTFEFNPGNTSLTLQDQEKNYLIKKYAELRTDKIDTLIWPLDVSSEEIVLMIDVSGTMFAKGFGIIKNGKLTTFFNYSLEKLSTFIKTEDVFKNASKIKIKLFGAKPAGLDVGIDESIEILPPRGIIIIQEFFYSSDNNKIEINVLKYEKPDSFNIYDSTEIAIRKLTMPYFSNDNRNSIVVQESPLLEDIVVNCLALNESVGNKCLIYMTDGYFMINREQELTPNSNTTLNELKEKYRNLNERIPNDSSIRFILFGMNTTGKLEFRDKLNGFYKWFLNDSTNYVKIINLK